MEKVGQLRLIKSGSQVWSIKNQAAIILAEDSIVEVKHTCYGNDAVFVEPRQLIFNFPGHIPGVIGRGTDEWSISYEKTEPYEVPPSQF